MCIFGVVWAIREIRGSIWRRQIGRWSYEFAGGDDGTVPVMDELW